MGEPDRRRKNGIILDRKVPPPYEARLFFEVPSPVTSSVT